MALSAYFWAAPFSLRARSLSIPTSPSPVMCGVHSTTRDTSSSLNTLLVLTLVFLKRAISGDSVSVKGNPGSQAAEKAYSWQSMNRGNLLPSSRQALLRCRLTPEYRANQHLLQVLQAAGTVATLPVDAGALLAGPRFDHPLGILLRKVPLGYSPPNNLLDTLFRLFVERPTTHLTIYRE